MELGVLPLAPRRHTQPRRARGHPPRQRHACRLAVASFLVALNWPAYVFAVNSGRTVDAALGHLTNPIVTVLLGVLVLRERLRPLQWEAVGYGVLPRIALVLAPGFGLYELVKSRAGRTAAALSGLAGETATLLPVASGYLISLALAGQATFGTEEAAHSALLLARTSSP